MAPIERRAASLLATDQRPVLALSGGVGGSKLALGLSRVLPAGCLTIVANTGDDFEHLGLHISPDIDTVTYVLAGVDNPVTGWGRRDETWSFMSTLSQLGGEAWFQLGDHDLAMHVERTRRLRQGQTLTRVTTDLARRLGIASRILPMTDDRVRTRVETREGVLDLQHYLVARRCVPEITGFRFEGAEQAAPQPELLRALRDPNLRAVIICPSNPFISVDPILALPGVRAALAEATAPVVAVSPIIAGRAVKGPTAKMMTELGLDVDPRAVAARYGNILDGFVMDLADLELAAMLDVPVETTRTLMQSLEDREALAHAVLGFADRIAARATRFMTGDRN
jgi:LPPG:FO 2-phospho-L-lactate transferase